MLRNVDGGVQVVVQRAVLLTCAAVSVLYVLGSYSFLDRLLQNIATNTLHLGIVSVAVFGITLTSGMLRRAVGDGALPHQFDATRNRLENELSHAARVQAQLLPDESLEVEGFELAATCVPAGEVSGDFYEWMETGPGNLKFTLGDVMGKGVPAALLMASARAVVRAVCQNSSPAEAMNVVARTLQDDLQRSGRFVTLFHAQLDVDSQCVSYVDAGHGLAFVRRADGTREVLRNGGLPLGILSEERYREGSVMLSPGDALIVYSDGLVGARPDSTLSSATIDAQLQEVTNATEMVSRLAGLAGLTGRPPRDDLTVMVLYCRGPVKREVERTPLSKGETLFAGAKRR